MIAALPGTDLQRIAVLIPAREPSPQLPALVDALCAAGFGAVMVLDDGSSAAAQPVFAALARREKVVLLRHAINLGKGRALKTAINHFLTELPGYEGLVTADADGQHAAEDIVRVAQALHEQPTRVVLGARTFSPDVPLRSRLGNEVTRSVFGFVTGRKLMDTQTGLRAFPTARLPELLPLDGERYEYEMTVLAHICRGSQAPVEVPIQTIYIEGNRSSHFDPIRDSMRIYFVLLRFYFSAIIAAGIDQIGFALAFQATHSVLAGTVIGRLSSLVNFALNKKIVFNSRTSVGSSIWRYYLLVAAIGSISYLAVQLLTARLHWNVYLSKLGVDTALSLVSFSVQRTFVFRAPPEDAEVQDSVPA